MCSTSPIAPITVTDSPREGCARAPTASIRSMTDWISSSVAAAFMTIIIWCSSDSRHWTLYVRQAPGRPVVDRFFAAERLEKSPGGVRVATTRGTGDAGGISTSGVCGAVRHASGKLYQLQSSAASASRKRSFSASVPTVTRSAPGRPSESPLRTRIARCARPLRTSRSASAGSSASGRSNQTKLACDSAGSRPRRRSPSSSPIRSARLRSTRRVTSSWWLSASTAAACAAALQKNGWRTWSTAVRNASEPQSAKPTRSPQRP